MHASFFPLIQTVRREIGAGDFSKDTKEKAAELSLLRLFWLTESA